MKSRILIIEDDPSITRMVRDNLVYEGFDVECVTRGDDALSQVRSFAPDLILLDLMLPGLDGFEICRAVSEGAVRVPLIVVSARSQSSDKIQCLELGADDYITKPFMFGELLARIHAVMRRTNPVTNEVDLGDIHLDFSAFRATKGKKPLSLTHREFSVARRGVQPAEPSEPANPACQFECEFRAIRTSDGRSKRNLRAGWRRDVGDYRVIQFALKLAF